MTSSMTASRMVPCASCRVPLRSACWVETTTVRTSTGRSSSYSTETWDFPSGRSQSIRGWPGSPLRTAASRSAMRCASMIGSGMRSRVSLVAYPNIMPWSPAPCSFFVPLFTPMAMSGDWRSIDVSTAQVRPSKP